MSSTRLVHRPARTVYPAKPPEPRQLPAPPALAPQRTGSGLHSLLPMAGAAISMSMMLLMRGSAFVAVGAVVMVLSLCGAGAFYFSQRGSAHRTRREERGAYLRYLDRLREELNGAHRAALGKNVIATPPADRLDDIARDPSRLWERRRTDDDFLRIRIGTGRVPYPCVHIQEERETTTSSDPFLEAEAADLARRFNTLEDAALEVPLDSVGHVSVIASDLEDARALVRTVVAQIAVSHAPDDVVVAVVCDADRAQYWEFLRWMPHALTSSNLNALGPRPLVVSSYTNLFALLGGSLRERINRAASFTRYAGGAFNPAQARLLIIADHSGPAAPLPLPRDLALSTLGMTVLTITDDRVHEASETMQRIHLDANQGLTLELASTDLDPMVAVGQPEFVTADRALGLARFLAPLRLSADSYEDGSGTPPADFCELIGISDPNALDLETLWKPRQEREFLRVPFGMTASGRPALLDLKESAQLGMGPHGLCVGATGAGKSELLRALLLALACTHSPASLNFMLVDYKGGSTFAPFEGLPHVAGLLTNLAADASLVERMYSSLEGEVLRRQEVLARADKATDIVEYNLRAAADPENLLPMPHLHVVIDEFGELLTAKPEFIELFLQIGRIGRSIGVHLTLSSQRLEEGKLRGLDAYLSYRIGLRTLSEGESRTVLGNTDAFHLPPLPGAGYLMVDVSIYDQFKAAYVSGPVAVDDDPDLLPSTVIRQIEDLTDPDQDLQLETDEPKASERTTGPTLLGTVVSQLSLASSVVARPVWLPPLPERVALTEIGYNLTSGAGGLRLSVGQGDGLSIPVGLLDNPAEQWQEPWHLRLSRTGHALIVGAPGTGKSTFLKTLAVSSSAVAEPTGIAVYGIDLYGNSLRMLEGLPNVGGMVGRDETERARRFFEEMELELRRREEYFEHKQIDSISDLMPSGASGSGPFADHIIYLIDGYGEVSAQHESQEAILHDVLARGARYGLHVVATARRWSEVRGPQLAAFVERIEFALADPGESMLNAKLSRTLRVDEPGRALTRDELFAQVALPQITSELESVNDSIFRAAAMLQSGARKSPPPIRILPPVLEAPPLEAKLTKTPGRILLGVRERDLGPVTLDLLGDDPHITVLGDSMSGKTNLLSWSAATLAAQYSPEELVFAVFDPRHALGPALRDEYVGGHASNSARAALLADAVATQLNERQGTEEVFEPSAERPRIVALLDDYDVLSASGTSPLNALTPFVPSGRDIGFHVILSRRVMGASRGLYDPFVSAVRESGGSTILLSGDPSEGLLFPGVRAQAQPQGRARVIKPGMPVEHVQTVRYGSETSTN